MSEQSEAALKLAEVASELRRHVRWAESLGETQAPRANAGASEWSAGAAASRPQASPGPASPVPASPVPASPAPQGSAPDLTWLRAEIGDCRRCRLCESRKNLVFGAGNPRPDVVFVGEGPDADEDEQGVPLAGKPGELLTKMIEAMGYRRDEVYVCSLVKCRPPEGRHPAPDELAACAPFLHAELEALQPKVIVALGQFAAQTLLRDATPITRLRGRWHTYRSIPLMPTLHPAYLLRSPAGKASAWADLKSVLARLGRAPPPRR